MKPTIFLPLVLACTLAQAADWVSVGTSRDGKQHLFVDVSTIRIDGTIRRVLDKVVLAPHTMRGRTDNWIDYDIAIQAYNCANGTSRTEALTRYYDNGDYEVIAEGEIPNLWKPVIRDTMDDTERTFICSWNGS